MSENKVTLKFNFSGTLFYFMTFLCMTTHLRVIAITTIQIANICLSEWGSEWVREGKCKVKSWPLWGQLKKVENRLLASMCFFFVWRLTIWKNDVKMQTFKLIWGKVYTLYDNRHLLNCHKTKTITINIFALNLQTTQTNLKF